MFYPTTLSCGCQISDNYPNRYKRLHVSIRGVNCPIEHVTTEKSDTYYCPVEEEQRRQDEKKRFQERDKNFCARTGMSRERLDYIRNM